MTQSQNIQKINNKLIIQQDDEQSLLNIPKLNQKVNFNNQNKQNTGQLIKFQQHKQQDQTNKSQDEQNLPNNQPNKKNKFISHKRPPSDLIDMIDSLNSYQTQKQKHLISQIINHEKQTYMSSIQIQAYHLYDRFIMEKGYQDKNNDNANNNIVDKSNIISALGFTGIDEGVKDQSNYTDNITEQVTQDMQILKNNILTYNAKYRSSEDFQDQTQIPLHRLAVCKCGAVFVAYPLLKMHIQKKHNSDMSFIVKFVGDDANTVKLQQNLGVNIQTMKQKNLNQYQRFQCKCGRVVTSYRALKIHITWQHSDDPQYVVQQKALRPQMLQYHNQNYKQGIPSKSGIFYCGCGKKYTCSSALNFHIRTKHDWKAPAGTIGGYGGYGSKIPDGYNVYIADKSRDQIPEKQKRPKKSNYQWFPEDQLPEKMEDTPRWKKQAITKEEPDNLDLKNKYVCKSFCGCGNFYSCHSALYTHIRNVHGGIPPEGTKGGPGLQIMVHKALSRKKVETQYFKNMDHAKCSLCDQANFEQCYFQCLVCNDHYLCQNCFFNKRQLIPGNHDWKVKEVMKENQLRGIQGIKMRKMKASWNQKDKDSN